MRLYRLEKKRFAEFIGRLMLDAEVIAPVKKDVVRFLPIAHPEEVHLEKNAFFPLKEYFFPQNQTLFQFDGKSFMAQVPKPKKRVFFGVRRCDLTAIRHQDIAFGEAGDPYYEAMRKSSLLIGYHCPKAPSPYCFCGSLPQIEYFDLMFFDQQTHFLIETGSEEGEKAVEEHAEVFVPAETPKPDTKIPGADRLHVGNIAPLYDHPDWKKGVDLCLSCGACTALCPTCYCFEIHDELSTADLSAGKRSRSWSSCQLPGFTRVAGDHVFRKEREHRFKHRIYHQLEYFKEKHGVPLCVGCGRCIEACPTRIDFVKLLNGMKA